MPGKSYSYTKLIRYKKGELVEEADGLAVEEPLSIRLEWTKDGQQEELDFAVTMRTPGRDYDLTAGLLFSENVLLNLDQLDDIFYDPEACKDKEVKNVVIARFKTGEHPRLTNLVRNLIMHSGCGVCSQSIMESIKVPASINNIKKNTLDISILQKLPEKLRADQYIFDKTGGLHAAALFDLNGELICLCEDIGRHNAVDKLVGKCLRRYPDKFTNSILLVSGRAGYELVQKALNAGIPIMASVGAPSSLAVTLAEKFGQTLIGFLKEHQFNIYSHAERIIQQVNIQNEN